jgi:molecular chaperone DnaK (HSP70)
MSNTKPDYFIGIDLGTTHTVVAYRKIDTADQTIQIFDINQLVDAGEVAARKLLPSVRYHPAEGEMNAADYNFTLPDDQVVIGEAARVLGAKSQGRLVTSAKSWLSHPGIDPQAALLPWGAAEDVEKISPVEASASYLKHVRMVWNQQHPDALMEHQQLVITIPASFDEAARALTLEAARLAGLNRIRLLEEPQAVCYDWLLRQSGNVSQALKDIHLLLICDVGGGTTDFTLIKIDADKQPPMTRIGVGDHLMLGGDNIDLALARLAESRLQTGDKKLSTAELSQLIEQCRLVKEKLLADDAPEQMNVTLLGGGSRLIGGSRTAVLTRDEVRNIALDGFFPLTPLDELPDKSRSGVVEFGLPYATDPAISKHIAAFLHDHAGEARKALGADSIVPDGLLLNGGVFRSQPITERLIKVLRHWSGQKPHLLKNPYPELAVARGAVSYAIARQHKKIQIGGGAARSFFLLVDAGQQKKQAVCLLPKGSEEGREILLQERKFALKVGQPVRFSLLSNSAEGDFKPGQLVTIDDKFHSLPPLAVALSGADQTEVIVQLAVTQTELGTLKIQCVSVDSPDQRWDVEFQIRRSRFQPANAGELPDNFQAAAEKIRLIYGARSKQVNPKAVKNLRAELEKTLGLSRLEWDTALTRALFDILLEGAKYRRRSENHERIWLSLAGFCLRPGFGFQLDDWRVEQLWRLYPQGIQFVNQAQNWSEWWTLWRRIAGGLDEAAQQTLFEAIAKYLNPASARQAGIAKQLKIRAYEDMVRLAGVLEHLPAEQKEQLGMWLLKRLQKASEPQQTWWALGRIGSRTPFYGSAHNVVPVDVVSQWITQTLAVDWKKHPQAGFCATLLARMSGDRSRDIDDRLRQQVMDKLKQSKAPAAWLSMLQTVQKLDEKQEKQVLGESLPPGLKLI